MAIKKTERYVLEAIEALTAQGMNKLQLSIAVGMNYPRIVRILKAVPHPFKADDYEAYARDFNLKASKNARKHIKN